MLYFAGSSLRPPRALLRRRRRSPVQLILVFMEAEDTARMATFWESLEAEQQAAVVMILTRLMIKAVEPGEKGDE
jgi:hypothetical protein